MEEWCFRQDRQVKGMSVSQLFLPYWGMQRQPRSLHSWITPVFSFKPEASFISSLFVFLHRLSSFVGNIERKRNAAAHDHDTEDYRTLETISPISLSICVYIVVFAWTGRIQIYIRLLTGVRSAARSCLGDSPRFPETDYSYKNTHRMGPEVGRSDALAVEFYKKGRLVKCHH